MADKPEAQADQPKDKANLTYRDADGKPHLVEDQEQAAREAQQSESEKGAQPELPGLINRAPD